MASDTVYDKAFDAWEVARNSAYDAWNELTDPNAFQPDLPLAFRDAYTLVLQRGGYLGRESQIELMKQNEVSRRRRCLAKSEVR